MANKHYYDSYRKMVDGLISSHGHDSAMEWSVGGQFRQIGILEFSALSTLGLAENDAVVDVGCGSGRLAFALKDFLKGRYVGLDILDDLLEHAKKTSGRPDWQFTQISESRIPLEDQSMDWAVFFSVFTHLYDEDIFRFLREARRVCRPGGKIVFSFLDFDVPSHWPVFEQTLVDTHYGTTNKFMSKSAIKKFSDELGLKIAHIFDGPHRWISLSESFEYIDGRTASGTVEFGQSVAVLTR